jgi:hypothetical protein
MFMYVHIYMFIYNYMYKNKLCTYLCRSAVLAGELSLMAALAANHLVRSHMQHNRRPTETTEVLKGTVMYLYMHMYVFTCEYIHIYGCICLYMISYATHVQHNRKPTETTEVLKGTVVYIYMNMYVFTCEYIHRYGCIYFIYDLICNTIQNQLKQQKL